jgi:hypothetical protein
MEDFQNIKNQELINSVKSKIIEKKKSVKSKFQKLNPQNKIIMKLEKKKLKSQRKLSNDLPEIIELIQNLKPDHELKLFSNKFDSPNIFEAVHRTFEIKNIWISTWAITDIGFLRIKELTDQGICFNVLLDKIHSYKWVVQYGAKDAITQNCNFYFTENHSKFQLYEFTNGEVLNIIGSMNFTNNPRYENLIINKCPLDFAYCKSFIEMVSIGSNEIQQQLFNDL